MANSAKIKKKKKLGSYPFVSVVFSISMALLVLGIFGLLLTHAQRLQQVIQENLEVEVILDKNISEPTRLKVQQSLRNKPYLAIQEGKAQLQYQSKEEAAEKFLDNPEEEIALIGENPLHDAFIIKLGQGYYTADSLQMVTSDIESLEGVFEVTYVKDLIQQIQENVTRISLVLLGLAVLLLIIVVVLIHNTIKLALFSQRFLIRSMQLVGATRGFIKQPFLLRSFLHGLLAGAIAALLIYWALQWAYQQIPELQILADHQVTLIMLGILTFLGGLIGWFSTQNAINKYLKLSLDELY